MEITKEQIQAYEDVRQSGLTNMYDVRRVISLADEPLTKDEILYIMKNYNDLITKYGIDRGE